MTSTVRASNLVNPVVISSLVEPPISSADAGEGYLAVQVNDRNGAGVQGVAVHAAGPTTDDVTTNQAGCAVFGRVGVGDYDVTLTKTGYVDEFGRDPGEKHDVSVVQGAKNVTVVKFDQAAPLTVTFETSNPRTPTSTLNSSGWTVSALDSEAPALLTWGSLSTSVSSMVINLFPFNTPYGSVYTGSCDDADPLAVVGSNYYSSFQGPFPAKPATAGSVKLHQPPVPIQIDRSGVDSPSAVVWAWGSCASGSGVEKYVLSTTTTTSGPGGQAGWVSRTSGTYDPGLPYGTYAICAKTTTGGSARWVQGNVTLNNATKGQSAGTTTLNATASSNPDTTKCPA
jgi:hypothetical protein